jgi:hypothetical protein
LLVRNAGTVLNDWAWIAHMTAEITRATINHGDITIVRN